MASIKSKNIERSVTNMCYQCFGIDLVFCISKINVKIHRINKAASLIE